MEGFLAELSKLVGIYRTCLGSILLQDASVPNTMYPFGVWSEDKATSIGGMEANWIEEEGKLSQHP